MGRLLVHVAFTLIHMNRGVFDGLKEHIEWLQEDLGQFGEFLPIFLPSQGAYYQMGMY